MATIRKGVERSPNSCYREYDVQFKLKKQLIPVSASVDELWLFYIQPEVKNNISNTPSQLSPHHSNSDLDSHRDHSARLYNKLWPLGSTPINVYNLHNLV